MSMSSLTIGRKGRGGGFTLIELLVVITIIAILAAILFPVFVRAREKALGTRCLAQMRQILLAAQMYADDWDDYLPPECFLSSGSTYLIRVPWIMADYTNNSTDIWFCPVQDVDVGPMGSYGLNAFLFYDPSRPMDRYPLSQVRVPEKCSMLWEGNGLCSYTYKWNYGVPKGAGVSQRHGGMGTFGFCDGHAKSFDTMPIEAMYWDVNAGNMSAVSYSLWPPPDPPSAEDDWGSYHTEDGGFWWDGVLTRMNDPQGAWLEPKLWVPSTALARSAEGL